jgi:hypothetical protein
VPTAARSSLRIGDDAGALFPDEQMRFFADLGQNDFPEPFDASATVTGSP